MNCTQILCNISQGSTGKGMKTKRIFNTLRDQAFVSFN